MEFDETLAEALRRELLEEVGLEACILGPCYAALVAHKSEDTLAVSLAATPVAEAMGEGLVLGEKVPADEDAPKGGDEEVGDVGWFTREEWVEFARQGRTPWREVDVLRGTLLADTLMDSPIDAQDLEDEDGCRAQGGGHGARARPGTG